MTRIADVAPREQLAQIVGGDAHLDDLLGDLQAELRVRPYELVFVSGGYQLRMRPRFLNHEWRADVGDVDEAEE